MPAKCVMDYITVRPTSTATARRLLRPRRWSDLLYSTIPATSSAAGSRPEAWNLYEGDLDVLRATGAYTQVLGSQPAGDRHCGLFYRGGGFRRAATRKVKFALVTGVQSGIEWSLGNASRGIVRTKTNPCP